MRLHEYAEIERQAEQLAATYDEDMSADTLAGLQQLPAAEAVHVRRVCCIAKHGCTPQQLHWRREADGKPWLRLVQPEQFMPLTPNTADIHQVVEHMVKIIKDAVKAKMQDVVINNNPKQLDVFNERTYQIFVNEAVKERQRRCWAQDHSGQLQTSAACAQNHCS